MPLIKISKKRKKKTKTTKNRPIRGRLKDSSDEIASFPSSFLCLNGQNELFDKVQPSKSCAVLVLKKAMLKDQQKGKKSSIDQMIEFPLSSSFNLMFFFAVMI